MMMKKDYLDQIKSICCDKELSKIQINESFSIRCEDFIEFINLFSKSLKELEIWSLEPKKSGGITNMKMNLPKLKKLSLISSAWILKHIEVKHL